MRRSRADRAYFGDFDPFGDFDLMFGAAKQNLKIVEVPVPTAREPMAKPRFRASATACCCLKMVLFAFRKLKAV